MWCVGVWMWVGEWDREEAHTHAGRRAGKPRGGVVLPSMKLCLHALADHGRSMCIDTYICTPRSTPNSPQSNQKQARTDGGEVHGVDGPGEGERGGLDEAPPEVSVRLDALCG